MITGLDWVLNLDEGLRALLEETHRQVRQRAEAEPDLSDLTGVFDGMPLTVRIDTWGHVTPEGNEIVARAVAREVAGAAVPMEESR